MRTWTMHEGPARWPRSRGLLLTVHGWREGEGAGLGWAGLRLSQTGGSTAAGQVQVQGQVQGAVPCPERGHCGRLIVLRATTGHGGCACRHWRWRGGRGMQSGVASGCSGGGGGPATPPPPPRRRLTSAAAAATRSERVSSERPGWLRRGPQRGRGLTSAAGAPASHLPAEWIDRPAELLPELEWIPAAVLLAQGAGAGVRGSREAREREALALWLAGWLAGWVRAGGRKRYAAVPRPEHVRSVRSAALGQQSAAHAAASARPCVGRRARGWPSNLAAGTHARGPARLAACVPATHARPTWQLRRPGLRRSTVECHTQN